MKTENLGYTFHQNSYKQSFKSAEMREKTQAVLKERMNMAENVNNRSIATAGMNSSGRLSFKSSAVVNAALPAARTLGEKLAVNKAFNKFLDILVDNTLIADALIALGLTTIARPLSIYAIPTKDPVEKKKNNYQVAHSAATGFLGLGTTLAVAEPIKRGVNELMKHPEKYMSKNIDYIEKNKRVFKETAGRLHQPIFLPLRAMLTIAIIKPILESFGLYKTGKPISPTDKAKIDYSFMSFKGGHDSSSFKNFVNVGSKFDIAQDRINSVKSSNNPSFKGAPSVVTKGIAKGIGKLAQTDAFRNFIEKFGKTENWFPHLIAAESLWLSGFYMQQTASSKKIEKDQKLPMILNQGITAILCTLGAYKLDGVIKNRLSQYAETYKRMNPHLEGKALDNKLLGIRLLGPLVIFTAIYRFVGPVVVTPIANKISEWIEPHKKELQKA